MNDKITKEIMQLQCEIGLLLDEIIKRNATLFGKQDIAPEDLHYGHVGDLVHVRDMLQEVLDFVDGKGER